MNADTGLEAQFVRLSRRPDRMASTVYRGLRDVSPERLIRTLGIPRFAGGHDARGIFEIVIASPATFASAEQLERRFNLQTGRLVGLLTESREQ